MPVNLRTQRPGWSDFLMKLDFPKDQGILWHIHPTAVFLN